MRLIGFVSDDVFSFASDCCDGVAVWTRTGSNQLAASWGNWKATVGRGRALRWIGDNDGEWSSQLQERNPRSRDATLLELLPYNPLSTPALYWLSVLPSKLQYLYLHQAGEVPLNEVGNRTLAALSELDRVGCQKIAMNGIHGAGGGTHNSPIDLENARIMVATTRAWLGSGERQHIEEVYLVDLGDGFLKAFDRAG